MDLLTYAFTTALIAAAPGPIMATIALRSLAGQSKNALAFAMGVILCEAVLLAGAIVGAVALLKAAPLVLEAISWIGVAYLLWLAFDLWHNPPALLPIAGRRGLADVSAGFVITIANPYNATFYLTVIPALGWRIEAMPGLVALATLTPSFLVYGGTVALATFGGRTLSLTDRPALRKALAIALGATALWIVVG